MTEIAFGLHVFQFAAKNRTVFQDIGSHDEVY